MSLDRRTRRARPQPIDTLRRAQRLVLLAASVLTILTAGAATAQAATFYIDAGKTDAPGCGTSAAAACRTYAFWVTSGCSNGCGDDVVGGDTVYFRAGTYAGDGAGRPLGIAFSGTAAAPVRVACMDAAGSCVITGAGVTPVNWCALAGIGLQPGTTHCGTAAASYVSFEGFRLQSIPRDMYGLLLTSQAHHVVVKGVTIDGAGANHSPVLVQSGTSFVTLKDNTVTNCPASDTGCTYVDSAANFAEVGNRFGPVATSGNFDCNTLLGVQNGLVDGNTCTRSADGFDQGMHSSRQLQRVIVRFNHVSGTTSRAFPLSGDRKDSGAHTGENILYRNVVQPDAAGVQGRCLELYEGAEGIDLWNNTCLASNTAGWGDVMWLDPRGDYQSYLVRKVNVKYNLFDTKSSNPSALIVLDQDAGTVSGCPSTAPCKMTGNGLWMAERAGTASAVHWDPSDAALAVYSCAQFSSTMNNGVHAGNFRANPAFVNRSTPTTLADLKLTAASTGYIDGGAPFCQATAAGSGNTITVQCNGVTNDPRHYFPDPTRFYGLANADCKGRGVRAADGVDPGCFDIQIQGACGVRSIAAMTANSITFSGSPCSWEGGAAVHLPWSGNGPDVGALEFNGAPPRLPAPVLHSVEPLG